MTIGVSRLEEREELAKLLDRRGLRRPCLQQLAFLEELHDRVEPPADLLIARLFEHAPQHRGPAWVARREKIGEPQKSLFQFAVLGEELLLTGGEGGRILPRRGVLWLGRGAAPCLRLLGERRQEWEAGEEHAADACHEPAWGGAPGPAWGDGHGPADDVAADGLRCHGRSNASLARCR